MSINLKGKFARLVVQRYQHHLPVYGTVAGAVETLADVKNAARKGGYTDEQTERITTDAAEVLVIAQRAVRRYARDMIVSATSAAAAFADTSDKIRRSFDESAASAERFRARVEDMSAGAR